MAINTSLLVATSILQEAILSKTGAPLSGGVVTLYQDSSRSYLKNWYQQTGSPGAYTYTALPNPMTLSAAGTITDSDGNDVIPFFYPYDEADPLQKQLYYITVHDSEGELQFTREQFPFSAQGGSSTGVTGSGVQNYITNNVFWRNIGNTNLQNETSIVIAPSGHDLYAYPDIMFIKNNTSGADAIAFVPFTLADEPILTDDITPQYYINHTCTSSPSGEVQKCYQFPISAGVNTLNSQQFTFTIQAKSNSLSEISFYIYQHLGTGVASPDPMLIETVTLSTAWEKYVVSGYFPGTAGLTLSPCADDALYLQVEMPLNSVCDVDFTKPSIYLGETNPPNDFSTYDQIAAILDTPRTGDIRISLNSFSPFGWVAANDGTIGSSASGATRANTDTWNLFNLIWSSVDVAYAPIYDSSGNDSTKGTSAYADFTANKRLSLTRQMGRALAAVGSGIDLSERVLGQYTGSESKTLTIDNLPPHSHDVYYRSSYGGTTSQLSPYVSSTYSATTVTTTSVGSSTPFDVTGPMSFYNVFFKL